MARPVSTDPYQGFNFIIEFPNGEVAGGFSTATTPELTVETAEYKTGTMKMRQKYPGNLAVNDVTLTRGLMKNNSQLHDFVKKTQTGEEYRTDVMIIQNHRDGTQKVYTLHEAFGMRAKLSADLDAMGNDVSVEELDIQYEDFTTVER